MAFGQLVLQDEQVYFLNRPKESVKLPVRKSWTELVSPEAHKYGI